MKAILLKLRCVFGMFFLVFSSSLGIYENISIEEDKDVINARNCYKQDESNGEAKRNDITFDFGVEDIRSGDSANFQIYSDSNDMIETLTLDYFGSYKITNLSKNRFNINLIFDDEEGQVNFSAKFTNGASSSNTLFYSKNDLNQIGLSTLSLDSAKYLVGNLEGQAYMDNDLTEAEDRGITPDFDENKNGPNRVIANGRVYGYLKWTDDNGIIHPLVGAKVKLTFTGSWGNALTYTNSSGFYSISFDGIWTAWAYECDIHVYAENEMIKVTNESGTVYEHATRLSGMSNNDNYNYSYTFLKETDLCNSMDIFTAAKNFADHASMLNGGSNIEICNIKYPCNSSGAYYEPSKSTITLPNENKRVSDTYHSVHESWDVIGHEYGHHLQKLYFHHDYYGSHSSSTSDKFTNLSLFAKRQNYVLKVSMYSSSRSGETRLAIAPVYGVQANDANNMNQFENFYNLNTYPNYTFNSYLATHYSKMVTWTVPEDGNYKISLTSDYDNYLYVIDPESSELNVYNVNYNDDCDGRNAGITGTFKKDKKYVIVYGQYNPSNQIGTDSVSADIVLKITKL